MHYLDHPVGNVNHRRLFSLPPICENTTAIPDAQVPDLTPSTLLLTGFGHQDTLIARSIENRQRQLEVKMRFGESIGQETPAERFCATALYQVSGGVSSTLDYDRAATAKRFKDRPDLMPYTLADCLHELGYWNELYLLRKACGVPGDRHTEATIREWFIFEVLAQIKPRSREEAQAVYQYIIDHDLEDQRGSRAIIKNLIG